MKLPTLSTLWKVLRNAVAALCGLVIVIALLPSKARSQRSEEHTSELQSPA